MRNKNERCRRKKGFELHGIDDAAVPSAVIDGAFGLEEVVVLEIDGMLANRNRRGFSVFADSKWRDPLNEVGGRSRSKSATTGVFRTGSLFVSRFIASKPET